MKKRKPTPEQIERLDDEYKSDTSYLVFISHSLVAYRGAIEIAEAAHKRVSKEHNLNPKHSDHYNRIVAEFKKLDKGCKYAKGLKRVDYFWQIFKEYDKGTPFQQTVAVFLRCSIDSYDFNIAKQKLRTRNGGRIPDGSWVLQCDFPERN